MERLSYHTSTIILYPPEPAKPGLCSELDTFLLFGSASYRLQVRIILL